MIFRKSIRCAVIKKVEKKIEEAQSQYYSEAKEMDLQTSLVVARAYLDCEEKKETLFNKLVSSIIQ